MNLPCRHCMAPVELPPGEPHDRPRPVCHRCAGMLVAERGRPREAGDDDRELTEDDDDADDLGDDLGELLIGIDEPDPSAPPAPETDEERRDRFHAARVASVRASWARGFRCLLARGLDADLTDPSWSRPQPR